MGVPQKTFTDTEILHRLLFSSVNEACRILEEGKAYRASDIDVMWLHGFGFPRYRGGLMYWADGIGVKRCLQPDRHLASAIRRALGAVEAAARTGGHRHAVQGGEAGTVCVRGDTAPATCSSVAGVRHLWPIPA